MAPGGRARCGSGCSPGRGGRGRSPGGSRDLSTGRRSGTVGNTSAIRSALGRVITVSAAATMHVSAPSSGDLERQPGGLCHVARVHVPPEVPPAQLGVIPEGREPGVVIGFHDVRDAQGHEADPGPSRELRGHRLAGQLRQCVAGLRARLDRLVDRREDRGHVERQPEDRLARRPDHAAQPVGDGRVEDVVRRQGVDPERLALRAQPGCRDRREVHDRVDAGERVHGPGRGP